ncbi:YkvA family protein [Parvularcula dongshanensis]|uniref:Uncharacterized membrane protein YkvA (DUF1232 family) n=1 Tax=Parvularcula dongshanensis TaxID=1173995 RepID=A0A840I1Z2_9PROT|nr:YkvA family protein [Parvularcula dongshanensis]MBB4658301.1 uncharacterized membrane protein YkvA (DUF1232 family) [Parvularcula dongshanensis]
MAGFWRRHGGESERMAAESASPSDAHAAKAKLLLEDASHMSEEDIGEARSRIDLEFVAKFVRVLSRLNPEVAVRLLAAYYALRDPGVPTHAKAGFALALLYFLNPVDLIPDAMPLIGLLDDAGVLAGIWMYLSGHVTPAHKEQAEAFLANA